MHDSPIGHELKTERQQTFLSFLDLAVGIVEVADRDGDRWDMKNFSVIPTAKTEIEWRAPLLLFKGILFHFLPWTYPYLKD